MKGGKSLYLGTIPKNGSPAEPGLHAAAPGSVHSTMPPVSVCQYVSTIGARDPPTSLWNQSHVDGAIGSPT